jgi:UDP-N-acetylmuramyl pentapeptide phosphotransferase/UDP-N-acetylglucosamine-1-phosphate transferase
MLFLEVFLSSAAITSIALLLILRSGLAKGFADNANKLQALHVEPIPRIGGIAMVIAVCAAISFYTDGITTNRAFSAIISGGTILVVVSVVDDFQSLSPAVRFVVHSLVASAVVWALLDPSRMQDWPFVLLMPVAALAIIWSMNAYNFMDGANGMAGFMAFIGFGAMAIASAFSGAHQLAVICAAISGAALGFLLLNFPTARVFMGDSGSILLGFLAATLGWYGWLAGAWALHFPLLVFSPFLVDATMTLLRRTFRGEKIWLPHRQHFYQRLIIDCKWSHRRTAMVYALIMLLASFDALRLHSGKSLTEQSDQWLLPLTALLVWVLIYGALLVIAESHIRRQYRTKK